MVCLTDTLSMQGEDYTLDQVDADALELMQKTLGELCESCIKVTEYNKFTVDTVAFEIMQKKIKESGESKLTENILDLFAHPNPFFRAWAAEYFYFVESPKALNKLLLGLQDTDSDVRKAIVSTLDRFEEEPITQALLKALEEDSDEDIQDYILYERSHLMRSEHIAQLRQSWYKTGRRSYSYAIATIQSNCKYYNHEIYQKSPEPEAIALAVIPAGTTINIETLGNLNTGTVNIQGDQIGAQNQQSAPKE
jgi:HEAT repeats